MATTVITGRDITFTIATTAYDGQTTSVTLTNSPTIDTYQTLDGKAYKHTDDQWTLAVELLSDWGATASLCEAMWSAAESAPNTAIAYSITAATGAVFAGNAYPVFPSVGGSAPGAQTQSWSMLVVGTPTETFS
ncbi:hypothetical protein UFOVP981_18 [uncultured Caudovirales phage]|uniref:Uncharacterized protein n=1 Tax=uncultured Caudovirales phage TaxID=2100421 RepID=A0A6J5Q311_9CAUD|nr:hypothetical protein UFOVP981_18 [uncultured Caudovirales phage]CAB4222441.1 hypothetical protein UFOVP1652_4 [uncultured Caudovirales phage]